MTTQLEARHLSGNDLGKTISMYDKNTGHSVTTLITGVTHSCLGVSVDWEATEHPKYRTFDLDLHQKVAVRGKPTPPGLNLHRSVLDQDE